MAINEPNSETARERTDPASADADTDLPDPDLNKIVKDVTSAFTEIFALIEVAEEEILAAQRRHGETPPMWEDGVLIGERGPLWSSFSLIRPTDTMVDAADFVYRAHCRELLDRVARGEDTRPATGPEMVLALSNTSKLAPLHGSAAGLYIRLFTRCFPEQADGLFDPINRTVEDYERIYGTQMDENEQWLRHKARQDWRTPAAKQSPDAGISSKKAA